MYNEGADWKEFMQTEQGEDRPKEKDRRKGVTQCF